MLEVVILLAKHGFCKRKQHAYKKKKKYMENIENRMHTKKKKKKIET